MSKIDASILIGFLIGMSVIVVLLNKLEKRYGVNRSEAGEPLKKIERSAGWISGISLLVIVFMAINGIAINYMMIVLFAGMLAFLQTLVEWKYVRSTHRSIVSLVLTAVLILSVLGLMEIVEWAVVNL